MQRMQLLAASLGSGGEVVLSSRGVKGDDQGALLGGVKARNKKLMQKVVLLAHLWQHIRLHMVSGSLCVCTHPPTAYAGTRTG